MNADLAALQEMADAVLAGVPASVHSGESPAALYGMGFLGEWAASHLPREGIGLAALFDANPSLAGMKVGGLQVQPASELESSKPAFIIVTARHAVPAVSAMLVERGIAHVSCDALHAARNFAAFAGIHDLLDDERSRQVLRAVLSAMLTGDRKHLLPVFEKDQYFCLPQFSGIEKEIYVDAGAYVGDSLERFIWTHYGVFHRAMAFEPGPRQFAALKHRINRLTTEWALDADQILLVPMALGETRHVGLAHSQNGQMTNLTIGAGDQEIRVESLDTYLDGRRITFLKADVEGMEMALLKGAAHTIRTHRPKLAICVYHYPPDIIEITHYLKSLVPEYRFALRHHSPQLMETVLYAWID